MTNIFHRGILTLRLNRGKIMNISLRKAKALNSSLEEQLKNISLSPTAVIDEFSNPDAVIMSSRKNFFNNFSLRNKLVAVIYEIRAALGVANDECGISNLLTTKALFQRQTKEYLSVLSNPDIVLSLSKETIAAKQAKIQKMEGNSSYYNKDTFCVGVLTQEDVDNLKIELSNLKKQSQSIDDQLLELNVKNSIVLSSDTESFLKENRLI